MSDWREYEIWRLLVTSFSDEWRKVVGFENVKARSEKEAQSKINRKMASGMYQGYCFKPVLVINPIGDQHD